MSEESQAENLNLEYNIKLIVCKALNTSATKSIAAKKMGISEINLEIKMRMCRNYKYYISYNETENLYTVKERDKPSKT